MNEIELLFFIKIVAFFLVLFWCFIAISILYRKHRTAQLISLENTFAEMVSRYLYNDPDNPLTLPAILKMLHKAGIRPGRKKNVQYLIRLMIRTQRTILGENNRRLRQLYAKIPPYNTSFKKLKSYSWYSKARGIREIYEMNQSQYLEEVFKYRDHRNLYVRREAQIALVVFTGWESLRFLPYLKRDLTLWQQIKIVEKLYDQYPQPDLKWLQRAYKSDRLFAKKLLMRIIRKFEIHGEVEFILKHLNHHDYEVRETAIYCINTFAVSTHQMNRVKLLYEDIPNATQQGQLLNYIVENSDFELGFYLRQLYGDNEELKLKIAEILWNKGYKEKVQEFYYLQYPNVKLNVG